MMKKLFFMVSGFLATYLVSAANNEFATPKVDAAIPAYVKKDGISGRIQSVGSDTLANLMTLWNEEFRRLYPNIELQVQAAGSSTAPPALVEGSSNLGPMSRAMQEKEIQAFEKRHGYKPTAIRVAIDALAVYVHKDNPLTQLTLPEVDAIFSSTRRCGHPEEIKKWGQLKLADSWKEQSILLYSRNSVSGTYGYFKEAALCKGDFKNTVNEQPGSSSVVQSVTTSLSSIGYSGIGYRTSGVRSLALAKKSGQPYIEATADNAISGKYPLSRYLYVYVNKHPNKPLAPHVKEFLHLVLSKQGQEIVVKDGYVPLPAAVVTKELEKLK